MVRPERSLFLQGRVPEATKADFQTYKKIKATGIYGTVRVPAAKIDTSALTLDVAHINERRHGVTQEEAVSYIKNAAFSRKAVTGQAKPS